MLQLKNFSGNLTVRIILDATIVPNLMFLGILSLEIILGEKNSHPVYFAIREPQ